MSVPLKPFHERLISLIKQNRVGSAYLFSGATLDTLKQEAIFSAQQLNCLETYRCGECIQCKKIERFTHPDIYWIDSLGESIKVEDIRELQKKLHYKPLEGKYQIVILMRADLLLTTSANALLKILEESPLHTIFMLLTTYAEQLLPTVISRCQRIKFPMTPPPLPEVDFVAELLTLPTITEDLFQLAEKIAETDNHFHASLEILIAWYRTLLLYRLQISPEPSVFDNKEILAKSEALKYSSEALYKKLGAVLETKRCLKFQMNRELLAEGLLIRLNALS